MITFDGTFYRITDPEFEMTIPAWAGYEPDTADEADATITFPLGGAARVRESNPRCQLGNCKALGS
ncbi:hypothetical protein ACQP2T_04265 [Nonomuraea sp. CA-143628]|uniref:hypothetical protein n=1 Tax=Nonomuraea sp. CA-143628 TaxID=3239997 RepID=UPI003D8EA7AE